MGYPPRTGTTATRGQGTRRGAVAAIAATVLACSPVGASAAVGFGPRTNVPTDPRPTTVAIADVTSDGIPDLLSGSLTTDHVQLHRGLGGGAFAAAAGMAAAGPVLDLTVADVDGDGHPDAVAASDPRYLTVLRLDAAGTPVSSQTLSVGGGPRAVAVGDLNRDGHADIVTINADSRNASVLIGHGPAGVSAGAFVDVGDFPVHGVLADVTGDGSLDIVAAVQRPPGVTVTAGRGDGTFARPIRLPAGIAPSAVAVTDIDGDGRADTIAANELSNEVTRSLGRGAGVFLTGRRSLTSAFPAHVVAGDWSGDGLVDIATANSGSDDITVLEGDGRGSSRPGVQVTAGRGPTRLASGDLTGDGRPDLVVVNGSGSSLSVLPGRADGAPARRVRRPCPAARRRAVSAEETRCVRLGMSPAQVVEVLGRARGARRLDGGADVRWHYDRLHVRLSGRLNTVTSLRTFAPGARTTDGLVVGSRVGDLARRLDPDVWQCARSGALQTCSSPALFTVTRYRVVAGRLAWIEVALLPDFLDLF